MPKLIIYTYPSKDYYFFRPQIEAHIKKAENNYISLLPVNRAVRYFRQQLIDVSPQKVLADPPVFTFDQLLSDLYRSLPSAKRIITNDHQLLILRTMLKERSAEFPYLLNNDSLTPGLVKKVADVLGELRRFGFSHKKFARAELPQRRQNPLKYNDIEKLLQLFESYLGKFLIDEAYARQEAAEEFSEKQFRKMFPEAENLYISGYGLFTPAMFTFIEKVKSFLDVHVRLDYNRNNSELFRHLQPAAARFQKMGGVFKETREKELDFLLFNRQKHKSPKLDFSTRLNIRGLLERREELVFMATEIRRLHQRDKIPLHRMALTFPNPERYVPLIRQVLPEFQIPYNLSAGFNLKQSPLIRLFLKALYLPQSGFEFERVLGFFQSDFISKTFQYDRALLRKIFVQLRCRYLSSGWPERVNDKIGAKEKEEKGLAQQLNGLQQLLEPFYHLPNRAPVREFRKTYIELLRSLGLLHWFKNENSFLNQRQKESEFRAYNRFMKLLEKVIWILDHIYGNEAIALSAFVEFLETALSGAVYNLTEWPEYGVQIMPRLEVLSINPHVLFVGGLSDGDFPRAGAKDVFFNDEVRDKLGLTASEELLDQDRYLFYLLLASPAQKIVLTYPRFEKERVLVPSTFLEDLAEVAILHHSQEQLSEEAVMNPQRLWLNLGQDIQRRHFDKAPEKIILLRSAGLANEAFFQRLFVNIAGNAARFFGTEFSEYEGNIIKYGEVTKDLRKRFEQRAWSVSRLEKYAFCPLQFFLEHILKIEELPEIEDEVTPSERGLLVHKILERFYRVLVKKGEADKPLRNRALLFKIAEEEFSALPYRGVLYELERDIFWGAEEEPGLLDVFLEYEQDQINESGFVPALFEESFGESEPLSLKQGDRILKIQGRIDRVDRNSSGQALIFDYKTGLSAEKISPDDIINGLHFQLPLYALALEKSVPRLKVPYAGFYILKDAEHCKRRELLADSDRLNYSPNNKNAWLPNKYVTDESGRQLSYEQVRQHSLSLALEKIERLIQGFFRHTRWPESPGCQKYCAYRRICQKNATKIQRAEKAPLT